jgi:hypothetical protein
MVKFILIDGPLAYNAIIGRTVLNQLRVVTSTPHLKMKFPTKIGVGEVRGDQLTARQCYNVTLRDTSYFRKGEPWNMMQHGKVAIIERGVGHGVGGSFGR